MDEFLTKRTILDQSKESYQWQISLWVSYFSNIHSWKLVYIQKWDWLMDLSCNCWTCFFFSYIMFNSISLDSHRSTCSIGPRIGQSHRQNYILLVTWPDSNGKAYEEHQMLYLLEIKGRAKMKWQTPIFILIQIRQVEWEPVVNQI